MGPRPTLKTLQEYAISKGGKLISTSYINSEEKVEWECGEKKHRWKAAWGNIRRGRWCVICDDESRKTDISEL
jgi:hypothetical protein